MKQILFTTCGDPGSDHSKCPRVSDNGELECSCPCHDKQIEIDDYVDKNGERV